MMAKKIHLERLIPEALAGFRLDQALAQLFPDFSRSRLQSWIREGAVLVDNEKLRPRDKVETGQTVIINAELKEEGSWKAQPLSLNIIYEDDALIVINKDSGVVVHPGAGNIENTLVNALLHYAPGLKTLPRAGLVHRLDKNTSGLLLVARSLPAHTRLVSQIQSRDVKREYEAITQQVMISGGTIDAPIGRHPTHRTKMAVVPGGKPAITHYRVIERFRAHTYLKIMLETGRTHQIRVHLAHIHYPIVGDPVYGGRSIIPPQCKDALKKALQQFPRQALHAKQITLHHPLTQELMSWTAPLPADMQTLLQLLREGFISHSREGGNP